VCPRSCSSSPCRLRLIAVGGPCPLLFVPLRNAWHMLGRIPSPIPQIPQPLALLPPAILSVSFSAFCISASLHFTLSRITSSIFAKVNRHDFSNSFIGVFQKRVKQLEIFSNRL